MFKWLKNLCIRITSNKVKLVAPQPLEPEIIPRPITPFEALTQENIFETLLPYFPETLQAEFLLTGNPFKVEHKKLGDNIPIVVFSTLTQHVYIYERVNKYCVGVSDSKYDACYMALLASIQSLNSTLKTIDKKNAKRWADYSPSKRAYNVCADRLENTALYVPIEESYKVFAETVTNVLAGTELKFVD